MEVGSSQKGWKLDALLAAACIAALSAAVVVLWAYFHKFPISFVYDNGQGEWGQLGDYVGGLLNPLFSVMAFFALLYTIRLQAKTIRLQSEEMANSTAQLKKSAEALTLQNLHNDRQRFDSRLFHLMTLHTQTLSSLKVVYYAPEKVPGGINIVTREFLGADAIHFVLLKLLDDNFVGIGKRSPADTVIEMERAYEAWKALYWPPLSRYFASISSLMRFVSESKDYVLDGFAIELLRSQLGDEEQRLLVYVCALDPSMLHALRFLAENGFGIAGAKKELSAPYLSDLVSLRLTGAFI